VGGFSGRVIAGFTAERWGWHWAFILLGCISLAIAAYLWVRLPAERGFALPATPTRLIDGLFDHLRNKQLVAAYFVGSCVLFSLTALFTYVTFHLAAPPFSLGPGYIGSIFIVYLVGAVVTPLAGRFIDRDGHGKIMIRAALLGTAGALLSLVPNVWMIVAGLAICSSGTFIAQASTTSFVGTAAKRNRALALGLYVSFYYAGGSFGGTAPGWLWQTFGWPGCVALVIVVQMVIAGVAWTHWSHQIYRTQRIVPRD
jgi:predicted MFS family arabinose efflux permease